MNILNKEFVQLHVKKAIENTARSQLFFVENKVSKEPEVNPISLVLQSVFGKCVINFNDEPFLSVLCAYGYMPMWFVIKMYELEGKTPYEELAKMLDGLVRSGMTYIQPSVYGDNIRPTKNLYFLLGKPWPGYKEPAYNSIMHDLSGAVTMWSIMNGTHILCSLESGLEKRESIFGLSRGLNIITDFIKTKKFIGLDVFHESEMKFIGQNTEDGRAKFQSINFEIRKLIESKYSGWESPELKDHSWFAESVKKSQDEFLYHYPDLVIPQPRKNGKPQSIAIEIELTNKRSVNYEETVERYANSIKYAKVYWLCDEEKTKSELRKAWDSSSVENKIPFEILDLQIPMPNN